LLFWWESPKVVWISGPCFIREGKRGYSEGIKNPYTGGGPARGSEGEEALDSFRKREWKLKIGEKGTRANFESDGEEWDVYGFFAKEGTLTESVHAFFAKGLTQSFVGKKMGTARVLVKRR